MQILLKYKWIILACFLYSFQSFKWIDASLSYDYYFSFVFQIWRLIYDNTIGLLPVPAIYLLVGYLFFFILNKLRQFKDYRIELRYNFFYKKLLFKLISGLCFIYFAFYLLWGLNYQRNNLTSELKLPTVHPDTSAIISEALFAVEKVNELRKRLSSDTISLSETFVSANLENQIRNDQKALLKTWNVPVYGNVRIRMLFPKGLLLRFSTAGIYIPFVMEGHIDAGLHPVQWPFVMAHEMAHGYGYTDEGDCNFIGFLSCISSDDLFIQYSGWIGYFRYVFFDLKSSAPASSKEISQTLDRGVINDLQAIYRYSDRYPDILPRLRDIVYESYLQSNGVKDGLRSYNNIIRQTIAWKDSELNNDVKSKVFKVDPAR